MSTLAAAESWVVALLLWAGYGVQVSFLFTWLQKYFVYSTLVTSSVNLFLHTIIPDMQDLAQAYFAFTFANSVFTAYLGLGAVDLNGVYGEGYNFTDMGTGGDNATDCCSNSDFPLFRQTWLLHGSDFGASVGGGILGGMVVIHLLVVGMSSIRPGQSVWVIPHVTAALSALVCSDLIAVLDGVVTPLCPDAMSYVTIFSIGLMRFPGLYFMFGAAYMFMLINYTLFSNKRKNIAILAIIHVILDCLFGAVTGITLYHRDILTSQILALMAFTFTMDLLFMVQKLIGLTRRERSEVGCEIPTGPVRQVRQKKTV